MTKNKQIQIPNKNIMKERRNIWKCIVKTDTKWT